MKHKQHGILGSASAMLATRALSILVGIALSVLLARWLAPEGYGDYLFTLTLAQVLALPILAGLPALVIRETAIARGNEDAASAAGILRWSLTFVAATSGVVITAGAIWLWLAAPEGGAPIFFLALPLVAALAFMQLGTAIVQGYEHPFAGNLGDGLIRPVVLLALVSFAALIGILTPHYAMWFHIIAAISAAGFAFGYWWLVCRKPSQTAKVTPRFETRKWLASLVPLSLVHAASLLNKRLDILMLGVLTSAAEVARYGIATQMAGLVVMGQTIINSIVAPKIARLYNRKEYDELRHMLTYAARLSTSMALVVLLFVFALGAQIIDFLLGPDYAASWDIAMILCVGNVFSSAMGPVAKVMNMTGNERIMARLVWLSALCNCILNLILVPIYGAVGAALATLGAQLTYQTLLVWWVAKRLQLNTTIFGGIIVR